MLFYTRDPELQRNELKRTEFSYEALFLLLYLRAMQGGGKPLGTRLRKRQD